jgi:hypothetical protein
LHDLRHTVATRLASFGVRLEVTEKVLNHVSGSFGGIVSVYQKHDFDDQKREALEAWARYVELLVDDALWSRLQDWLTEGDRDEESARRREFNAAILEGGMRWQSVRVVVRGEIAENILPMRSRGSG